MLFLEPLHVHCLLISDAVSVRNEVQYICIAANGHCCIMCDFLIHQQSSCIPRHLYTNRYVIYRNAPSEVRAQQGIYTYIEFWQRVLTVEEDIG